MGAFFYYFWNFESVAQPVLTQSVNALLHKNPSYSLKVKGEGKNLITKKIFIFSYFNFDLFVFCIYASKYLLAKCLEVSMIILDLYETSKSSNLIHTEAYSRSLKKTPWLILYFIYFIERIVLVNTILQKQLKFLFHMHTLLFVLLLFVIILLDFWKIFKSLWLPFWNHFVL